MAMFLTLHLVITLQVTNLNAASALGVESSSKDGDSNRNLRVAREGSRDNNVADLKLSVEDRTSITLDLRSTADEWEARSGRLAANLAVHAAKADLSGASGAVRVLWGG